MNYRLKPSLGLPMQQMVKIKKVKMEKQNWNIKIWVFKSNIEIQAEMFSTFSTKMSQKECCDIKRHGVTVNIEWLNVSVLL